MDLHLEYIVDQTSKYSDWIAKDLQCPNSSNSSSERVTPGSVEGECIQTFISIKCLSLQLMFPFNNTNVKLMYIYIYEKPALWAIFLVGLWPPAATYLFGLLAVSCRGCVGICGALPHSSDLVIPKFYI